MTLASPGSTGGLHKAAWNWENMMRALCYAVLLCALPNLRAEQPAGMESDGPASPGKAVVETPLQVQPAGGRGQLTSVEENDVFTPIGQDQHYTQGAKLVYLSPSLDPGSCWAQPFDWLHSIWLFGRPQFPDDRIEWTVLGQSLFTPKDLSRSNPSTRDRPYAGWLYTGINFVQDNNRRELTSFEILGGVVGSYALGRQTQNDFHEFQGGHKAFGWGYQLKNEFGFVASWERKWRLI
ncbi:MAG: lipid A deacylase LpxR family protein, partial [Verrucomicrobia bacterium]|nr:lipid A deacylase LpxR family protein [Verrucomicrobiota bacterium]